jgi:transposase-like protein
MAPNRKFTEEQMESLRGNQYILSVGEDMVFYTDEFKRLCWQMYSEEMLMPKEIMRRLGVDYHTLGIPRVRGLMYNLKKQHESDGDFSGDRGTERPKRREKYTTEQQLERANAENEYLRQELEFVKKIIAAGGGVK